MSSLHRVSGMPGSLVVFVKRTSTSRYIGHHRVWILLPARKGGKREQYNETAKERYLPHGEPRRGDDCSESLMVKRTNLVAILTLILQLNPNPRLLCPT